MIHIGKVTNTHGLKGEIRILSNFPYPESVFEKNKIININNKDYKIISSRNHKEYNLIFLENIDVIEKAEILKSHQVYIDRKQINDDLILKEDIIGFEIYENDIQIAIVINLIYGKQTLLETNKGYIPYVDEFIEKIDLENKKIYVKLIEGLL